jgi:hypothetical protein
MPSQLQGNFGAGSRNPFNYQKVVQSNRDIVSQWLTLDEITNQLNLFADESQDAYLEALELATRMAIEDYLGFPICNVTYEVGYMISGLMAAPVSLDFPEVSQTGVIINSVKYYNDLNPPVLTTITSSNYYFDPTGNKLVLFEVPNNINTYMTAPMLCQYTLQGSVIGQYPVVKQAGLMLLTHFYNNRSAISEAKQYQLPWAIDQLLRPYKSLVM